MALSTNNPIASDGQSYGLLAVSMALSPLWGTTGLSCSIAVRLTPYRLGDGGTPESLDDAARAVVFGDARHAAQSDPDLAQFLQAIESAGQAFIDAKGL